MERSRARCYVSGLSDVFPQNGVRWIWGTFPLIWRECQRCYPISSDVDINPAIWHSGVFNAPPFLFKQNVWMGFVGAEHATGKTGSQGDHPQSDNCILPGEEGGSSRCGGRCRRGYSRSVSGRVSVRCWICVWWWVCVVAVQGSFGQTFSGGLGDHGGDLRRDIKIRSVYNGTISDMLSVCEWLKTERSQSQPSSCLSPPRQMW